jgi:hypothetical protein
MDCRLQTVQPMKPGKTVLLLTLAFGAACDGDESDFNRSAGKSTVAGFDFKGFQILKKKSGGQCKFFVAPKEQLACNAAGGETVFASNCKPLCSEPIAPKGKVAGYDFTGPVIRKAPPKGIKCPAVQTAEAEACSAIGGDATKDDSCNVLCDTPIAREGEVAGFDFAGFHVQNALPPGTACTLIATPESDACFDVGGDGSRDENCNILCNRPIAK